MLRTLAVVVVGDAADLLDRCRCRCHCRDCHCSSGPAIRSMRRATTIRQTHRHCPQIRLADRIRMRHHRPDGGDCRANRCPCFRCSDRWTRCRRTDVESTKRGCTNRRRSAGVADDGRRWCRRRRCRWLDAGFLGTREMEELLVELF